MCEFLLRVSFQAGNCNGQKCSAPWPVVPWTMFMLDKAKCTVELFTINYVWVAISGTVRDHKSQQSSKKMTHGTLQTQKNKITSPKSKIE